MMPETKNFRNWLFIITIAFLFPLAAFTKSAHGELVGDKILSDEHVTPQGITFTGAATHTIPIPVPPGRGNVAPNLALSYNSYQQNGWIGVGWDLSFGAIQRATKQGLDYSANDFVISAAGSIADLVQRNDWGGNYYGAKIESEFTKYLYLSESSGWVGYAKDGFKYFFGVAANSRQTNIKGTFKWALDRVEDSSGNYMTITYTTDNGQLYPDTIAYTGNTAGLATTNFIKFHFEDRIDIEMSFAINVEVKTAKRLKSIDIMANGTHVGAYKLVY